MKSLQIILSMLFVVLYLVLIPDSAQARHKFRSNLGWPLSCQQYDAGYFHPNRGHHYGWYRGSYWAPHKKWHWDKKHDWQGWRHRYYDDDCD